MKSLIKSAVFSVVGLSAVVAAGCSKARWEDDSVSPDSGQVEIALGAEFGVSGGITSDSGLSRAVIDKGYSKALYVSFARLDQNETTGTYPAYSSVDSAFLAKWAGALTDDDSQATTVRFCDPKFYLSRSSNNSTKFVGWYPAYPTQTALGAGGSVEIPIDGATDIMLSEELAGSKAVKFGNFVSAGHANNRIFHFGHQLTQLHFYAYAVDAYAPAVWGKIKSVKLKSQRPTCKIVLPAAVSFTGTRADLELTKKKVSDDSAINYTSGLAFTFDSAVAVGAPNEQTLREASAVECGYSLIAPVADADSGGSLSLLIVTEKAGSPAETIETPVTVTLPADGFEAGKAYNIYLRFSAVTIQPKATISKWVVAPDPVNIEM
ncbi:MAG: hypothetical protein K2I85_04240 [Alistipes sp.]|nr:hypothetical protein [Alistipes sp.]